MLFSSYLPELYMGLSSLLVHKLRSLLTMLGMIFGVGAVVAMLSITAGAQKEMMSFMPQHKGAEKLRADLRLRYKKLKEKLEVQKKKKKKRNFTIILFSRLKTVEKIQN